MATPIPAFVSQFFPVSAGTYIMEENGVATYLDATIWYYLASNRTTVANGMSLLKELEVALLASSGFAWTVRLTSAGIVQFAHATGGTTTLTMSSDLSTALGYDQSGQSIPNATTSQGTMPSRLFWSPGMPISMTGPQQFDPALNYGVPSSAGNVQRAPDMTAAAVSNGIQWAAEYRFNGVTPYYLVRKVAASSNHVNEDLETFWSTNLALGRRVLMWRDRLNLVGSNAPSEGSASPYNYVEYFPAPELREKLPGTPMVPYVLTHWDVSLPFLVTENGETPLTD